MLARVRANPGVLKPSDGVPRNVAVLVFGVDDRTRTAHQGMERPPLDIMVVRKLGVPGFEQLAISMIASGEFAGRC